MSSSDRHVTIAHRGPAANRPEADVAHAGVDHLRAAGSWAVALAVVVGAQERAALDHLAWHAELRLCGSKLASTSGPRGFRHAAGLVGIGRMLLRVPVGRSTPTRCRPCRGGRTSFGWERPDRSGAGEAVGPGVAPREVALPEVGEVPTVGNGLVTPGERLPVDATAGCVLPFGLASATPPLPTSA